MWQDRVSNPGPLTYESGALPIALRGPTKIINIIHISLLLKTIKMRFCCCNSGKKEAISDQGPVVQN